MDEVEGGAERVTDGVERDELEGRLEREEGVRRPVSQPVCGGAAVVSSVCVVGHGSSVGELTLWSNSCA